MQGIVVRILLTVDEAAGRKRDGLLSRSSSSRDLDSLNRKPFFPLKLRRIETDRKKHFSIGYCGDILVTGQENLGHI